jgi:CHAT domain-containing protein
MTLLREMDAIRDTNSKNLLALAPFSGEISETDRRMMSHRYSENSDQLFFTRYETEQISSTFNEGSVRASSLPSDQKTEILMGDEATTSRLMKTPLSDYDYIHFATHAFINEENPEFSAILLYPEEENSGAKYVSDIYGLELDANLVVLGACQTGLGSIYKGEGIIGFTRAFIYAGTSNLATSLWKVNDQPTAYLMVDFYEQIQQGFSYSEALRRAKLKLIESPRFASPVNWAAFTLTGR